MNSKPHPDHSKTKNRIRRIQGQVLAIERMIDDGQYCVEILAQVRAASLALRSLHGVILETHLQSCVAEAIQSKDAKAADKKIAELMEVLKWS